MSWFGGCQSAVLRSQIAGSDKRFVDGNVGRQVGVGGMLVTDNAAIFGVTDRLGWLVSGQQIFFTKTMVRDVVCDSANDRILVSPTCQLRQMLADLDTLDIGRDGFEFTTHFDGRIRFEIKGVLMGWAAFKKNEDARPFGCIGCFRRMHTQVLG